MRDDLLYLGHIRDAIGAITAYTSEGKATFFQDPKTRDAVIRQIEIIGEATKNMSDASKEGYPGIPWKDIAGMRDKLIHHYAGVDLKLVWDVVERELPPLLKAIEEMLKKQ